MVSEENLQTCIDMVLSLQLANDMKKLKLDAGASRREIPEIAHRRLATLVTGEIAHGSSCVDGEELGLSPMLLLYLGGLVAVRYIAVGLESADFYVLGGIGMGLGVYARFFLYRGIHR